MCPHLFLRVSGSLSAHFPDDPLMLDGGFFDAAFQGEHAQFHLVPLRVEILNDQPGAFVLGHCKEQRMQFAIGNEPLIQPRLFLLFIAWATPG